MSNENVSVLTQHLTEEISGHTNLLLAQRTRNNLIYSVGPFVILGGVATNSAALEGVKSLSNMEFSLGIAVIMLSFLILGYVGARIEERLWSQCNVWRSEIARLNGLEAGHLTFKTDGIILTYMAIFGIVGLVVSSLFYILHTAS